MSRRKDIRKAQRGVSLVEILVVLMIAAMVAGLVVMSMPPLRSEARHESERFAARLTMAAEEAVTKGEMIGLKVSEDGYRFYRYDRGEWKSAGAAFAGEGAFPEDLAVEMVFADAAKKNEKSETRKETKDRPRPDITFSPTGETTPFEIAFQENRSTMRVVLDSAGKVEVTADAQPQ